MPKPELSKTKPTEKQKKEKATLEKVKGKIFVKGKELDVDIEVETTPNVNGGYDTVVRVPASPIGARVSNPGQ